MDRIPLQELEKAKGLLAIDRKKYPAEMLLSEADFDEIFRKNTKDFQGCDHAPRIAFLKRNGYEVTHQNMLNADLPAVPKE